MDTERFVADCVSALREHTLNGLVKFIDHFKQKNFVNDHVMEEQ